VLSAVDRLESSLRARATLCAALDRDVFPYYQLLFLDPERELEVAVADGRVVVLDTGDEDEPPRPLPGRRPTSNPTAWWSRCPSRSRARSA
jgi:hypothetical protein